MLRSGMVRTRRRVALHALVGLTVVGCLTIVAGGWRAEEEAEALGAGEDAAQPAEDSRLARARANVTDVDADAGRVVLSLPGEQVQLRVDERTTVFVNGRPGGLDEIEEGQLVCA